MTLRIDGTLRRGDLTLELELELPLGITAITGPNGAGKSSILRLVAGLEALDEGRLTLDDVVLDDRAAGIFLPAERRDVSMTFQQPRLFPHLTVLQNIAYPLRRKGHTAAEASRLAQPFAERVGAGHLLDLRPRRLSGGQAQRTAIAVAMAARASTILLDEPLGAIDETGTTDIRRLLLDHDTPRVIWVTHDSADAENADHHITLGLP